MNPKVLISVLNWNNYQDTIACILALDKQTYKNYQVLVIDNHSQDNSVAEIKNNFPTLPFIESPSNEGYAGGHLLAVEYATQHHFDLIWILNNDALPFENTLEELVNAFLENPNALYGSVSLENDRKTIGYGGGSEPNAEGKMEYNIWGKQNYWEVKDKMTKRKVIDIDGSSMLLPMTIIQKYGFMDTQCFLYAEETDYCYYLNQKNVDSIIVPTAVIVHQGGASLKKKNTLKYVSIYYRTRNLLWFHKKHNGVTNQRILQNHQMSYAMLLFFFLKHLIYKLIKSQQLTYEYWLKYYEYLGIFHALRGVRGKYISPEDFL